MAEHADILVFSPHPDDAEIGCGGSLILAVGQGLRVAIADLTEGEQSTRGTPERRAQEKRTAAEVLGLSSRFSVGLPDTQVGTDHAHRQPIIQLIRETTPRIVLAPYPNYRHPDHAAAGKLVQAACFFAGVSKVGSGVPHRPERLFFYMLHYPFVPSFVVNVSAVWSQKLAAVAAYESQFPSLAGQLGAGGLAGGDPDTAISGGRLMRIIEARAVWFGAMIGTDFGEAFASPGPVPLRALPGTDGPLAANGDLPPYSVFL